MLFDLSGAPIWPATAIGHEPNVVYEQRYQAMLAAEPDIVARIPQVQASVRKLEDAWNAARDGLKD